MPSAAWRNADAAYRERRRREARAVDSGGLYNAVSVTPEWDAFFGSLHDQEAAANDAGLNYRVDLGSIGRDGYEGMDPGGRPNNRFLAQTLASEDISRRLQAQNAERDFVNQQRQQANINDLYSGYLNQVQASDAAPPVAPHDITKDTTGQTPKYTIRETPQTQREAILNALPRGAVAVRAQYEKQFADEDIAAEKARLAASGAAHGGMGSSGAVPMSDDAVDYAAAQVRILGNGANVLTRLNDDDRKRILNKVADQSKSLGQTPAQAIQKQYAFKSDAKSLDLIQKLSSTAEAAEQKALGQANIVSELSDKVSRSRWPIINAALQAGRTEIAGDPEATQLANAINTFASEYAKIIEGSTGSVAGSSDTARATANKLIAAKMSNKQLAGVLDLMKREMALTIQGYDVTRSKISERMGGGPAAPGEGAPSPAAAGGGVIFARDPQGKLHQAAAGTPLPPGWKEEKR